MVAEKTAKNFRGLLYFAAPCRNVWSRSGGCQSKRKTKEDLDRGCAKTLLGT